MQSYDLNKTFSEVDPGVNIGRSVFTGLSHSLKTTLREGELTPVLCKEVLAGDTFELDTSFLARMATPIFPVADNAFLDVFYFYVPNRLIWDKYRNFLGENTEAPWIQDVEYTIPQITFDVMQSVDDEGHLGYLRQKSLMNYIGVPTLPPFERNESYSFSVSDLPNRAYRLIWNEFFRDQNVQYPVAVYTDSNDRAYTIENGTVLDYGDKLLRVNRIHDYFSSVLPGPQKGPSVPASVISNRIPVIARPDVIDLSSYSADFVDNLKYARYVDGEWSYDFPSGGNWLMVNNSGDAGFSVAGSGLTSFVTPDNLYAELSAAQITTVNTLRSAFAIQRFYELQARAGSRYREILQAFFGVSVGDSRVQVPEYLGGDRVPINMDQVIQTSSTDSISPQGNTAGYSLTTDSRSSFTKSFVEPGILMGLVCIRVDHTYSQSVDPFLFRKRRFDFYWPQFANLGEQPVYAKYIFAGTSQDDDVFGYQEAFADYRYSPNRVSGGFSPIFLVDSSDPTSYQYAPSQLAQAWSYADFYETVPTLSSEWLQESSEPIGQTLALPEDDQFILDFYFKIKAVRPLPARSIPGLIDHH